MATSGTYNFELANSDIVLEAFDRCEMRPSSLTGEHMVSAKRSLNLELQRWSNLGVNLWKMDLLTLNLQQDVLTYTLPQETVSLLDVYLRQFTLGNAFNVAANFSIVITSQVVTVVVASHGLVTEQWINLVTPISIGNLLLQGFYQLTSVPNSNTFTIQSPVAATSTVSSGGVVPLFTATAGQSTMQVTLNNHTQSVNSTFIVQASTAVAGITLYGGYTVTAVADSSHFTISVLNQANSNVSVSENLGMAQFQSQNQNADPIDNIMTPLGRTDYAMIPDKYAQGTPTTYWFNRQSVPQISVYQAPDQNGPYQLCMWRMLRCQDANASMGETPDIPYRFIDCLCAQLAVRLAMKYAKQMLDALGPAAKAAWDEAAIEDRERADIMIMPMLDGYYRD